jgi:hypothetical protein
LDFKLFSFSDSKSILFVVSSIYGDVASCSTDIFFLYVQSEIVVHEVEEKGMSFLFEIPNFLQSDVY